MTKSLNSETIVIVAVSFVHGALISDYVFALALGFFFLCRI